MIAEATRFACPHCGADVEATPDMAGWVAECPDCHGEIKIDGPQTATRRKVFLKQHAQQREQLNQHAPSPEQWTRLIEAVQKQAEDVHQIRNFIAALIILTCLLGIMLGLAGEI